jgi:hypothetical protein
LQDKLQRALKDTESFPKLLIGYREQYKQADDVVVATGRKQDQAAFPAEAHDLLRFQCGRLLRSTTTNELNSLHRPQPRDVAYGCPLRLPSLPPRHELSAKLQSTVSKIVLMQRV